MEFNAADANFENYAFSQLQLSVLLLLRCSVLQSVMHYAAEARSFYARSSSFKTQTVFASVSDTSIQCNDL